VEKDYKILDIYEVYEYQVTQYKRKTNEGGLFLDYINRFIKHKPRQAVILVGFETPKKKRDICIPLKIVTELY